MRRNLILAATLACIAASARAEPLPIPMVASQYKDFGRLNFTIGGLPTPEVRNVPGGVDLAFPTPRPQRVNQYNKIRELGGFDTHTEPGHFVVSLKLTCDCAVKTVRNGKTFSVILNDTPAAGGPSAGQPKNDLALLRQQIAAKLAQLNAPVPVIPGQAVSANPGDMAAAPVPLPACPADFSMAGWRGKGGYVSRLTALRHAAAETHEAPPDMAALAEFYIGNGLGNEAQETARTALTGDIPPSDADRVRLQRDADIASLIRGEPIDAKSPLLADRTDCTREDLPLWRALNAAASHDPVGVVRDAHAAAAALGGMPETLLHIFSSRLSYVAGDDIPTLRDLAAALRNASLGFPQDEASRFLMQAKMARAGGDMVDEMNFLERAARYPRTIPGIVATERLAELASARDDSAGRRAADVLADMTRVYRGQSIGQNAAAALADRFLRHGDYAKALRVADESASPDGVQGTDSRGATLVAGVLRKLMENRQSEHSPDVSERIALYLKYDGYATPGQTGDDIRIGAARLMMGQDLGAAALDALRQLSDASAAKPEVKLLRAAAEASAGDPTAATLLLRDLPVSPETQRIEATALVRLQRPADAAHALDGLPSVGDRIRRAGLLADAASWPEAVAAYAELLRDPGLRGDARRDVSERYASALALAGEVPDASLPKAGGEAERMLSALPPAKAPAELTLPAIQGALDRAKDVETLLPKTDTRQGS